MGAPPDRPTVIQSPAYPPDRSFDIIRRGPDIDASFDSRPRFVPQSCAMTIGKSRSDMLPGAAMARVL